MMQELKLEIPRTAHYAILGEPGPQVKQIWVVCHGYGQLAKYFLRHFQVIADEQTLVVAPEALSKFYVNGHSGRVGASWMTKENREDEIKDYVSYLDLLFEQISGKCAENAVLNVLGFSQGAATVCRWLSESRFRCQKLVLWAGAFPPDVDVSQVKEVLGEAELFYVHGNQDELVPEEKLQKNIKQLAVQGLNFKLLRFEGGHELDKNMLLTLV